MATYAVVEPTVAFDCYPESELTCSAGPKGYLEPSFVSSARVSLLVKINAAPPRQLMDVLVARVSPVSHTVPFS